MDSSYPAHDEPSIPATAPGAADDRGEAQASVTLDAELSDDEVAVVRLSRLGDRAELVAAEMLAAFDELLTSLERRPGLRGVVLASAGPDGFGPGVWWPELLELPHQALVRELDRGAAFAARIERGRLPVVAAIHGPCAGTALELLLACHERVGSVDPATRVAFPHVRMGLSPAAGASVRLPRVTGTSTALQLLLEAGELSARMARQVGLFDEVVPAPILLDVARERAVELAGRGRLKKRGFVVQRGSLAERLFADNPIAHKVLFREFRDRIEERTRGHYPAPLRTLLAVKAGVRQSEDAGLAEERTAFLALAKSEPTRHLVRLQFEAGTSPCPPEPGTAQAAPAREPVAVTVHGAGPRGTTLVYLCAALSRIPTRWHARREKELAAGDRQLKELVRRRVKRKLLTSAEREEALDLVSASSGPDAFAGTPIVIDAAEGGLTRSLKLLKITEKRGDEHTVFAHAGPVESVSLLASRASAPERVAGLHYLEPAHRVPIAEITVTDATAPWVAASLAELVRRQGKSPIFIRDGVGRVGARLTLTYLLEAMRCVSDGANPEEVDAALLDFGFGYGALAHADELSLPAVKDMADLVSEALGERLAAPRILKSLLRAGRRGRAEGAGFHRYSEKKRRLQPDGRFLESFELTASGLAASDIAERCAMLVVAEAARLVDERVVWRAADVDVVAVLGAGFPAFLGGPLCWLDHLGAGSVVTRLEALRVRHGDRFAVPRLLLRAAAEGQRLAAWDQRLHGDLGESDSAVHGREAMVGLRAGVTRRESA